MEKVVAGAEELPKAIVRRVLKNKLSQCHKGDFDLTVHKDAVLAFAESSRIFIHYLSATANDICKEKKRQTISADDVLKALEEIEFPEFIQPLEASIKGKSPAKKEGKKGEKKAETSNTNEVNKRRKLGESSSQKQKEKVEESQDENEGSDE